MGPTIVIIKSKKGNVFGVYSSLSYNGGLLNGHKKDPDSFLFSLTNMTKHKALNHQN